MYIGLMSGTSLDGVDAALVDFALGQPRVLATHFAPFPPALRAQFMALQAPGDDELTRAALAANQLAQSYAEGVAEVLRSSGVPRSAVRAIGAHGQTVRHRPEAGFTLQLNNPALLAELTGKSVILGVIDLGDAGVETPGVVADRIRLGLKHVPADRLILAPDCGMKYLPRATALGKLAAMVEGAAIVRREISGTA